MDEISSLDTELQPSIQTLIHTLFSHYESIIKLSKINDSPNRFSRDNIISYLKSDNIKRTIFKCSILDSSYSYNYEESRLLVNYLDAMIIQGLFNDYFSSYKRYFSIMICEIDKLDFMKQVDTNQIKNIINEVVEKYIERGFMCTFSMENTPMFLYNKLYNDDNNDHEYEDKYTFRLYYGNMIDELKITAKSDITINEKLSTYYDLNNPILIIKKDDLSDGFIIEYGNQKIGYILENYRPEALYFKYYHSKIHDYFLGWFNGWEE